MVNKSVKQQVHKDFTNYVDRVYNVANGTISKNVQSELNTFIKKNYIIGVRDNANIDHKIQHCAVYCTDSKVGTDHNLWFMDGKITHYKPTADNNYSYTKDKGVYLINQLRIDTDVRSDLFASSDCSMGYFLTLQIESTGEIGGISDTGSRRFFTHPQYTNTRGIYFDVGSSPAGRTVGSLPGTTKNNKGLTICTKFNTTGIVQLRDILVATNTGLTASLPMPTGYQELNPGYTNSDILSIGGYWWGKNVNGNVFTNLTEIWNNLQNAISPKRIDFTENISNPLELSGIALWFDATDSSTVIRQPGTQNITQWNDKSGSEKNAIAAAGNSVPYVNNDTINFGSFNVNFKSTSGFFFGCVAIVFTPGQSVNFNSGGNNGRTLLGTENVQNYSGIRFGSTTTALQNEVLGLMYASSDRVAFISTSFTFNANQRYLMIFNRRGGNDIDIYIDSSKVTTTYNLSPPLISDKEFAIGGGYQNVAYFIGGYHEIVNYKAGLNSTDVERLKTYLIDKWSIA